MNCRPTVSNPSNKSTNPTVSKKNTDIVMCCNRAFEMNSNGIKRFEIEIQHVSLRAARFNC